MRACPECGQSVKLENMKRHFANVHPGKDPSAAISEQEHREIVRANRSTGSSTVRGTVLKVALVVVIIVGAGYFTLPYLLGVHPGPNTDIVSYCGLEGTIEHYHPLLVINVNGVQQHLPYDSSAGADVGGINQPGFTNPSYYCPSGELHVLHTHDGSGIIHAELPFTPSSAPTLGQFFQIWGEPLTQAQVWTYTGTVTAQMYNSDTHTSTDFSSNPGSVPLYEPAAGPLGGAYNIPQSLIFNGAYGNGQSGGMFSGEVIWLNVTA